MATSKIHRITYTLFAILLLANIATIAIFWRDRSRLHKGSHPQGVVRRLLIKELNFDAGQLSKYDSMVTAHREQVDSLRQVIAQSRRFSYEALKDASVSDSTLASGAMKTADLVHHLELSTLLHFRDVRAICSTQQRSRFDGLLKEVSIRMGSEERPPHGPGPRP